VQLEESIAANLEAMGSMVSKVGFPQVEMRKPLKGLTHGETPENLSAPGSMEMEKTIENQKTIIFQIPSRFNFGGVNCWLSILEFQSFHH